MLTTLWRKLFHPAAPTPAASRRLVERVSALTPEYEVLKARLVSMNLPYAERARRQALDVLYDAENGRVWELVILDDGPGQLYGLDTYEPR